MIARLARIAGPMFIMEGAGGEMYWDKTKNWFVTGYSRTPLRIEPGTFLDRALFTKNRNKEKEGYKRKLVDWIRECITDWNYENNVPSVCLDRLVERGILGKERKLAGIKTDYPTKKPEPRKNLSSGIRKIALVEVKPIVT
ncbi:hypothetical protein OS493_036927 [Desmophyllum pertusum]|uniref:Uncharacterized protein n=1 Tax=Desmophyllum pertusum TaxID=174260 RepID=A0A9X0D6F4_9CNID|nr:hypothetical protein OS493_036927 [Desmophyllum pertusum]